MDSRFVNKISFAEYWLMNNSLIDRINTSANLCDMPKLTNSSRFKFRPIFDAKTVLVRNWKIEVQRKVCAVCSHVYGVRSGMADNSIM